MVDFTMGRLNVEFDPEDMTEEQIENFRKAPIMEKVVMNSLLFALCV